MCVYVMCVCVSMRVSMCVYLWRRSEIAVRMSFSVSFETGSEFAVLAGLQVVSLWRSTCFCSIAQQSFNPLFTGPGDRLNMYIF